MYVDIKMSSERVFFFKKRKEFKLRFNIDAFTLHSVYQFFFSVFFLCFFDKKYLIYVHSCNGTIKMVAPFSFNKPFINFAYTSYGMLMR